MGAQFRDEVLGLYTCMLVLLLVLHETIGNAIPVLGTSRRSSKFHLLGFLLFLIMIGVLWYIAPQMSNQLQHLKQAFKDLRQALETAESALIEFEETLGGEEEAPDRPQGQESMDLLSIPEVCQELGMGKSWVYRRLRSGEIPSVKLGHNIKVKRQDLNQYLESHYYEPSSE